jgi:hypothetical protein
MLGSAAAVLGLLIFWSNTYFIIASQILLLYLMLVFLDSLFQNKSVPVALLSIVTTVVMLYGYGWGFFRNWWAYNISGKKNGLKL